MIFHIPERRTDLATRAQYDAMISEIRKTQNGIMYYHELTQDSRCDALTERLASELAYYMQQACTLPATERTNDLMRVSDIQDDESLTFVSDSQDVAAIKDAIGLRSADCTCSAFFVEAANGEYVRVYGIRGIIPHQYKQLTDHSPER